jgi:lysophospholipase L1-like esterase
MKSWFFHILIGTGLTIAACNPNPGSMTRAAEVKNLTETDSERQFEQEIQTFEREEADSPSTRGAIVFTGSSSIARWKTLSHDMAPATVINRGFGGSGIRQVTFFAPRILLPLKPKAIFFYCGENDICNDHSKATQPLEDYKNFVALIRQHLPDARVYYIGMKPSPNRWKYWDKFQEANRLIQEFSKEERGLRYVDLSKSMLAADGFPRKDIWLQDSLHLNELGYQLWTSQLKPLVWSEFKSR